MKKIEEIEMGTYANQDIMTRSVNLWSKQNELIRAFNGLYDAVNHIKEEYDIRCHEIEKRLGVNTKIFRPETEDQKPKVPVRFDIDTRETPVSKKIEELTKKVWDKKIKYINDCYNEAMSAMNAIAYGDADPKHPEIRLVAGTNDTWSCRALAEKAIEKLKQSVRAASITSMDLLNEEVE